MTPLLLARCLGISDGRARIWAGPITEAMNAYAITSPKRMAAFLAQVGHESGRLRYSVELWGPTPAQARYEGRKDLGNCMPGDGFRYRGRGLIQITGRANYERVSKRLGFDFVADPAALGMSRWAALGAADFWGEHRLNEYADREDFEGLTRKINGGLNGLAEREALWADCKEALNA